MNNVISGVVDQNTIILYGEVFGATNLQGEVNVTSPLLLGDINSNWELIGDVIASYHDSYDKYKGNYVVVPSTNVQELPTMNKLMDRNVTVKEIPYYEISNSYGGDTIVIGSEL